MGCYRTPPMTLNDSPPLPPNEPIGVRKSVRGANFTPKEDKLLVSAWLNCSLDAVQGTDQKHSQLWEKIFEYFQQYKETTNEWTIKSLIHRWSVIQKATNKFFFYLETENGIENEVIELDRPMGRKAEKGNRKAQGRQVEENFQLRKMKYTLLEELCAQEKEFYRLKAEKMEYDKEKESIKLRLEDERLRLEAEMLRIEAEKEQSKIHQEDKRLRLEAEKVKLEKKESDQRIMMMDVSVMPEMQWLYFQQLQREIIMRRSNARDLD
ncbi:hypothetical protein CIPAW_03G201300 [Carya illinoinensis]|uniref:No apical meristem-associated C-terminal domain-containing protein n=1 Tax=Carya illinoinensis TaxID=32201 RepID=A0A8T1R3Q6_CARIL|nr:hypothetical protein CIPAW_03G201300 [Carya illinoinensis]